MLEGPDSAVGGIKHEPLGRAVQDRAAPFRTCMWIRERVVSQWTRCAASAAREQRWAPEQGGVRRDDERTSQFARVGVTRRNLSCASGKGAPKRGVRVTFSKVANDKSIERASGFWATGKRSGARGGGGGDFYQELGTRDPWASPRRRHRYIQTSESSNSQKSED